MSTSGQSGKLCMKVGAFIRGTAGRRPIDVQVSYDRADPWAATLRMPGIGKPFVDWTFARELLAKGQFEKVGEGDVTLSPMTVETGSGEGSSFVRMDLRTKQGLAILELSMPDLAAATRAIYDAVSDVQAEATSMASVTDASLDALLGSYFSESVLASFNGGPETPVEIEYSTQTPDSLKVNLSPPSAKPFFWKMKVSVLRDALTGSVDNGNLMLVPFLKDGRPFIRLDVTQKDFPGQLDLPRELIEKVLERAFQLQVPEVTDAAIHDWLDGN